MNVAVFEAKLAEKNKTQKQMAEEIDMPAPRVSEMKAGRLTGWKYQRRISQYLGVPVEILFPENGNQESCHPQ
jgi:transcriptional regulator with XRE-family HTH domain